MSEQSVIQTLWPELPWSFPSDVPVAQGALRSFLVKQTNVLFSFIVAHQNALCVRSRSNSGSVVNAFPSSFFA